MKFKTITYPFRVIEYFDILTFHKIKRYTKGDHTYGEFYFEAGGIPKYYLNCFEANSALIEEMKGQDIERAIREKLESNGIKIDKPWRSFLIFEIRDWGIVNLDLEQIFNL